MSGPSRIAMWSGPRNLSTALMRAWENRADTAVVDEPLYGVYLSATGIDHPGRDDVLAHMSTDWRYVVRSLTGPVPDGKTIWYQKHMAHHLLPEMDHDWVFGLTNAFLIRDPAAMLASYVRRRETVTVADLGLPQQVALFDQLCERAGSPPPVIDAADVLTDPAGTLAALCAALGVAFDAAMLSWPAGPRPTDGVWAKHWYDSVQRSTGFAPYRPQPITLPDHLQAIAEACRPYYDRLHQARLSSAPSPLAGESGER